MNIYITKVEPSHLFVISQQKEWIAVDKPDGKTYKHIPRLADFVTNNEVATSLTDDEKKDKKADYIVSEHSILDCQGYEALEIMISNIPKLTGRNFLFYFRSDDLMLKDIDNNKEILAEKIENSKIDEAMDFFGTALVRFEYSKPDFFE